MLSVSLRERGFLPIPNPLEKLPSEYERVDRLGAELPTIFSTDRCRKYLANFPLINVSSLKGAALLRAGVIFNHAQSAWYWNHAHCQTESPVNYIPRNLAVPSFIINEKLGMPPILSYYFYCLNNWRFLDREDDFNPDNLHTIQNFVPDDCENWFIVIHVSIEHHAGRGLAAFIEAQQAAKQDELKAAKDKLHEVAASLEKMIAVLKRMPERCRPEDYYHRVRPQIKLFTNVVYEGVEKFGNRPQSFRGETGAQSSIIPAFCRFLGIRHTATPLKTHLDDMINYMPPLHRAFLEEVPEQTLNGSAIRDYVFNKLPQTFWERTSAYFERYHINGQSKRLRNVYNDCIRLLHQFRTIHLGYAKTYIQGPTGDTTGTGGTPYIPWLTQMTDETLHFII